MRDPKKQFPKEVGKDLIWCEVFSAPRMTPALFLDRDGVLIEEIGYLHDVKDIKIISGAIEVICFAKSLGLHVVLVTNQSGIGRGYFGWKEFADVQHYLYELITSGGGVLDAVLACPFHEDGAIPFRHNSHPCRKPNPGMLLKAAKILHIDLENSWIIGDTVEDIRAGCNAGLAGGLHVFTGHGPSQRKLVQTLSKDNYRIEFANTIADAIDIVPLLS